MIFEKNAKRFKNGIIWFWKWKYRNYVLIFATFCVWTVFLAPNNIFVQYRIAKELRLLKESKQYYQSEIKRNKDFIKLFSNDTAFMEAYAREKHLMKRKNEDIYTIHIQEDIKTYHKDND